MSEPTERDKPDPSKVDLTQPSDGVSEGDAPAPAAEASPAPAEPAPLPSRAPASAHATEPAGAAAWGRPFWKFDQWWTRLETGLLTVVLLSLAFSLVSWVLLGGLSAPVMEAKAGEEAVAAAANRGGTVFRAAIGAAVFGTLGWFVTRGRPERLRQGVTFAAVVIGIAIAPAWRKVGVDYFDNVKAWLQEGSTLTLFGGLRGLGTRLTLWLALLGASIATALGKHIHIDVVYRFLPVKLRIPAAILNCVVTAGMCLTGAWGFFDHISIESFGAKADDPPPAKIEKVTHELGSHLRQVRRQIGLDLRTLPRVATGTRYDQWMTPDLWNEWVAGAGYEDEYGKEKVEPFYANTRARIQSLEIARASAAASASAAAASAAPAGSGAPAGSPGVEPCPADTTPPAPPEPLVEDTTPKIPLVANPSGESQRGLLVHGLGLVFPFGLVMIALRFLLRGVLFASKHLSADPNEAHREEIGAHSDEAAAAKGGA